MAGQNTVSRNDASQQARFPQTARQNMRTDNILIL